MGKRAEMKDNVADIKRRYLGIETHTKGNVTGTWNVSCIDRALEEAYKMGFILGGVK